MEISYKTTGIIHNYPKLKDTRLKRFTQEVLEEYSRISINIENYTKWKMGINYKTNRKINIGGKTYIKIGEENHFLKYEKVHGIDIKSYLEETKKIKQKIEDYNFKIYEIIEKINLLKDWHEYIEFEGEKYGIPKIYQGIHRENNCLGEIRQFSKDCTCSSCENWFGCGNSTISYNFCEKCKRII